MLLHYLVLSVYHALSLHVVLSCLTLCRFQTTPSGTAGFWPSVTVLLTVAGFALRVQRDVF